MTLSLTATTPTRTETRVTLPLTPLLEVSSLVVLQTTPPLTATTPTRIEARVTLPVIPLPEVSSLVVALPTISPIALLEGQAGRDLLSSLSGKRSQTQSTRSAWLVTPSGKPAMPSVKRGNTSVSSRTRRLKSECVFDYSCR